MGVLSDQEDMMKPLEPALNAAIILMTHRLLPAGYRVAEEAPSTYEAIASHLDSGNQMVVYSGGSENTIYVAAQDQGQPPAGPDRGHFGRDGLRHGDDAFGVTEPVGRRHRAERRRGQIAAVLDVQDCAFGR